ncbi:MAG: hypothetical protein Q9217_003132 [Psora testacea]
MNGLEIHNRHPPDLGRPIIQQLRLTNAGDSTRANRLLVYSPQFYEEDRRGRAAISAYNLRRMRIGAFTYSCLGSQIWLASLETTGRMAPHSPYGDGWDMPWLGHGGSNPIQTTGSRKVLCRLRLGTVSF